MDIHILSETQNPFNFLLLFFFKNKSKYNNFFVNPIFVFLSLNSHSLSLHNRTVYIHISLSLSILIS